MAALLRSLMRPLFIRSMLAREWWQSGVTYNPFSPRVFENPYPTYAALRAKDPIHWSPLMNGWVFARYKDIDTMLRDHRRFSSDPRTRANPRQRGADTESDESRGPQGVADATGGSQSQKAIGRTLGQAKGVQ